jgi:hypothetical protein
MPPSVHHLIARHLMLLIAIMVIVGVLGRASAGYDLRGCQAGPTSDGRRPLWHGFGRPALMLFGSVVSGGYAAALVL